MLKPKACKHCGMSGHTTMNCFTRPKSRIKLGPKMRPIGKQGRKWLSTRAEWFRENPRGHYTCFYCLERLAHKETTLDHLQSRGRAPELRYELANLVPCCWKDNQEKGSRSADEYLIKKYGTTLTKRLAEYAL